MSFLLATDNGTPAEVASFTNTGAFSNIGGLDAYGSSVIFRLRNTTPSTGGVNASPKLELMGTAWNSAQGNVPSRGYLQVNVNNTNQNPFINRLGFFLATGDNTGGWNYGADATEYMSILGNGTVGINTTIPLGTLDIRPISASNKGIVIKGAASQTANLQEWQDSAGTVLANIDSTGRFLSTRPFRTDDVITAGSQTATLGQISAISSSSSRIGLVVRGAVSQAVNLQEWQNNAGTILLSITPDGSIKGGNSNTISVNTASTVDTVALSSFTSMEYTLSIKQGSKIRSSKVLVHTDGTSVDSTEYGIMEMGGGITGILVTASVSSTNAILQVTITDAATTNATVKLIKTML